MNDKYRYGIIILHYLAEEVTKQCVEAIRHLKDSDRCLIVVIDNASPNNSGERIKKNYEAYNNIKVILSEENLGFARGNNIGYTYLSKIASIKFIVAINNDVIIRMNDFFDKIEKIYLEDQYAVLGPDIEVAYSGIHQSPTRLKGLDLYQVLELKKEFIQRNKHFLLWFIKNKLVRMKKHICMKNTSQIEYRIKYENPVLHGACYIFSELFIEKRKYAFSPRTFLYLEEDILFYECMQEKLKLLYDPSIKVYHYEDISTSYAIKNIYRREKMKTEEVLNSIDVLLDIMRGK